MMTARRMQRTLYILKWTEPAGTHGKIVPTYYQMSAVNFNNTSTENYSKQAKLTLLLSDVLPLLGIAVFF